MSAWTSRDEQVLDELLRIDTVTPMETGRASALPHAQRVLAEHAADAGLEVAHLAPPAPSALRRAGVPRSVIERAAEMGEADFLECQPNMVLVRSRGGAPDRTLVVNSHLDTVSGDVPVARSGDRISGRGAIDAKGPAVAAVAGIRHAATTGALDDIDVVLQSVGGEEGGAMGVYGTREAVELGYTGRLSIVVEPTGLGFFDHGTSTMTMRVSVEGVGATDDAPDAGDNATLILAFVTCELARRAGPVAEAAGCKFCIAGLSTGTTHNRVYGEGVLLVNVAYRTLADGEHLAALMDATIADSIDRFRERFGQSCLARRSAERMPRILRPEWLKRGLPVLANRDPEMERLLERAGVARLDPAGDRPPFTCDAMWLQGNGGYTVVHGPGDLVANGAHSPREHARLADLAAFADSVAAVATEFARSRVAA